MDKPKVYRTKAIVLRHSRLGEADKILTLYTPYLGKIRATAKGVLRPTSRIGGHVETLNHSMLLLARGRNLDIVTQAQTIDSFQPIRLDLSRASAGFYTAEIVDRLTEEEAPSYQIYHLLLNTLHWLCEGENPLLTLCYLELQLLDLTGFRPELVLCLRCREPVPQSTNLFNPALGGLLCAGCGSEEDGSRWISVNSLKVMRFLQGSGLQEAMRLQVDGGLMREVESILRQYVSYVLEREVRSARFLDLVGRG